MSLVKQNAYNFYDSAEPGFLKLIDISYEIIYLLGKNPVAQN